MNLTENDYEAIRWIWSGAKNREGFTYSVSPWKLEGAIRKGLVREVPRSHPGGYPHWVLTEEGRRFAIVDEVMAS